MLNKVVRLFSARSHLKSGDLVVLNYDKFIKSVKYKYGTNELRDFIDSIKDKLCVVYQTEEQKKKRVVSIFNDLPQNNDGKIGEVSIHERYLTKLTKEEAIKHFCDKNTEQ